MVAEAGADFLDALLDVVRIGETATREIDLIDIERMAIDERAERFASALGLACGNRDRRTVAQPDVAIDVIGPQWFLQPADVELRELLRAAQGGARIPNTAGVDEQRGVACAFAGAADKLQIERLALAHRFPAKFDGGIAGLGPAPCDLGGLSAIPAEQNRGVCFDSFVLFAAEQTMNRLAEDLSFEI